MCSLEGSAVASQNVVQILFVYSSPMVSTLKRRLGTNGTHHVWMATCDERVERVGCYYMICDRAKQAGAFCKFGFQLLVPNAEDAQGAEQRKRKMDASPSRDSERNNGARTRTVF